VQTAVKALEAGLKKQTSGYKTSAVSIGVKSLHERKQLLNWHHTPPVYSGIGTEEVDENTIYRVGSVSKVFAALVALQNADIDLDASVLEYIPELRDPSNSTNGVAATPWEDVTVRSLMNHLSGIATDSE
jgi:CubicO group peptidase (beta-lactamase class C family)